MVYFVLLAMGGFMIAMGLRANVLNLEIRQITEGVGYSREQATVWHEMGGFNMLLLNFGPNTVMSFLAGVGALAAYLGLWMCVLGKLSGLFVVIVGVAVCGLIQYTMIVGIKAYFTSYEQEMGEDPRPYFTGNNGIPHAVYTSVMIGVGKAVKFILLVSLVGIFLYVIIKQAVLKTIDLEAAAIRGDYQFPPKIIYDEQENAWFCTDTMGEDGCIKVYSPAPGGKAADRNIRIYVDSEKALKENPNATGMIAGNRTFHW